MEENGRIWNERSKNNDIWSRPVTTEEVTLARKGIWNIVLTPQKKYLRIGFRLICSTKRYYVWQAEVDSKDQL